MDGSIPKNSLLRNKPQTLKPSNPKPMNRFKFKLTNGTDADYNIAILHGNVDVTGTTITQAAETPFAVSAVTVHRHNKTHLNTYGVAVDAVLDDGTIATGLEASPANSQYTIRHFLDHIKVNPQVCTRMIIEASNADVFQGDIFFKQGTPLDGSPVKSIAMSDYLGTDQNIDTKIIIPFYNNPFPVTDETIAWLKLAKSRIVSITMELAPLTA